MWRKLKQNTKTNDSQLLSLKLLKDPSQPMPFSMPSKLLILHGGAKSFCFTVSCVPENMFHYLK